MKFTITKRWSWLSPITVELDASLEDKPLGIQLGAAAKVALRANAVLTGAVLAGAVLAGAELRGAKLRGAVLRNAEQ